MQHRPIMPSARRSRPADTARGVFWKLVWIYQGGCAAAIGVTMTLVLLGLEFSFRQWIIMIGLMPVAIAVYNSIDVVVIARQFAPIGRALRELDERGTAPEAVIADALVRALNLPLFSFVRVTFLHGPLVSLLIWILMTAANPLFGAGNAQWQVLTFAATALFFASPSHAIFEYFAVSRAVIPTILKLSRALGDVLPPQYHGGLVAVRLKSKLLYLAIFVAALPLIFFALSTIFKIYRVFILSGIEPSPKVMLPLYMWIGGVVAVCLIGTVVMALLTAQEVSRSARRLIDNMRLIEGGKLDDVAIEVVSTDEYADIFRGFQHMLVALREEQRILAVSHDLAGELNLDSLIARIMRETTELLDAERSTLFIHDPKTGELYSVFAEGELTQQIRLPCDRGIAGAVFTRGVPENIADPYADPRFDQAVDRRTGFRTRSILCHPIVDKRGGRIGVTQVLNKRGGTFLPRDELRLRAFSAQIAVSIENAKLFEDVSNMKNYTQSILKSTSNGIITFDLDNRITTANDAALAMLGSEMEVTGRMMREVFAGDNRWIASRLERKDWSRETQLAADATIMANGETTASVNLSAAPLIDAAEQRIGSMLVMEDITSEKRVRSTMARYMSKEVTDQLLAAGESELVGKDQEVSILFADVRGFTTIAEAIGARETVTMLNAYFTEMVDVILDNGGILDKYIGDAIMALFGAPFASPDDADNAVRTANQMLTALAAFNARRVDAGHKPLEIGIGVSTGNVIVGNIGSAKRMEYTVIGDNVNLASRLEGANKVYGTRILFSEFTRSKLTAPLLSRELDLIRVKGKDFPVAVHEGLDWRSAELDRGLGCMLEAFGRGVALYRAREWHDAEQQFLAALTASPGDNPSRIYVERCRAFAATPPPPDWQGVWSLSSK